MNLVRYSLPRRFWIAAVCALVFTGCGHTAKNDPVAAMNDFLSLLSRQHYREAYESASVLFQIDFNETAFEAVARDAGLGDFISSNWTPESVTGNEARLNGELVNKTNDKLSFRATLIRESGRWKLFLLEARPPKDPTKLVDMFARLKRGTDFNQAFSRQLPNDDEIRKLVTGTMQKFNECLHEKDFKAFYEYTSVLWQSRTTGSQVARAFKPYLDAGLTLDFIKDVKMIYQEPPRLNSDGYLLVNGYYPTRPRVIFHLQYIFELPRWKVIGITLSVEP